MLQHHFSSYNMACLRLANVFLPTYRQAGESQRSVQLVPVILVHGAKGDWLFLNKGLIASEKCSVLARQPPLHASSRPLRCCEKDAWVGRSAALEEFLSFLPLMQKMDALGWGLRLA